MMRGRELKNTASWKRAADMMARWFGNVAFPADSWGDAPRYKWNTGATLVFYDSKAWDFRTALDDDR